jgi:outer membrane assembly lipoprotein YfiO
MILKNLLLVGLAFLLFSVQAASGVAHIDHFERGREYFYQGKIKEAGIEFKEALRHNPGLDEIDRQLAVESTIYLKKIKEKEGHAASSKYEAAKDYEAEGNFIAAANAYQELIEQYPDSKEVASALDGLYRVATGILEKGGRPRLFAESNYSRARKLFQFLSERLPFGEKKARAQYKIGLSYFYDRVFPKAVLYYNRVVKNYPQSPYAEKAFFGIAMAYLNQSISTPRDQTMTMRARDKFRSFQRLFPNSPLQKDAEEKLFLLNERLAEHLYRIGTFYKKQGELAAAKIYYESILNDYPETSWAALGRARLNELTTKAAMR